MEILSLPASPAPKHAEQRTDTRTAARVNDALGILAASGMSASLEFMQLVGVPRAVVWRVLSFQAHKRRQPRS